jgi:MFS family permease
VVAILAFCQAMVLAEMVLYGTHDLHLSQTAYGLAFAAFSSGNILGSLAASRVRARLGDFGAIVAASICAGVPYLALALTNTVALAVVVMFIEAVAVAVGNVTTLTLRQHLIPQHLLGRVGSVFRTLVYGSIPLGALVGGVIAAAATVRWAFAVAGALQLGALVVILPLLGRRLRLDAVELSGEAVGR